MAGVAHVTFGYNEDFTFISFILFFCRVDSWCKLVFNYGKPTVNMFYDYDYYDYDYDNKLEYSC